MMQPMDKLDSMIQGYMLCLALRTAYIMRMELMRAIVTREEKRLTEALGHEPTEENWEDYWQLLGDRAVKQKARQREADREKIRRLLMVDNNGTSKTS